MIAPGDLRNRAHRLRPTPATSRSRRRRPPPAVRHCAGATEPSGSMPPTCAPVTAPNDRSGDAIGRRTSTSSPTRRRQSTTISPIPGDLTSDPPDPVRWGPAATPRFPAGRAVPCPGGARRADSDQSGCQCRPNRRLMSLNGTTRYKATPRYSEHGDERQEEPDDDQHHVAGQSGREVLDQVLDLLVRHIGADEAGADRVLPRHRHERRDQEKGDPVHGGGDLLGLSLAGCTR